MKRITKLLNFAGAGKTFSKVESELALYNYSSLQDAYDRLYAYMQKYNWQQQREKYRVC